jgi:hypothetical protein
MARLNASGVLMSGFVFYRDTDAGTGEIDTAGHHLTLLDKVVDYFWIVGGYVCWRVGSDLLHQRRTGLADNHLVPCGALEGGGNIAHPDTTPMLVRMVSSAALTKPVDKTLITPSVMAARPLHRG